MFNSTSPPPVLMPLFITLHYNDMLIFTARWLLAARILMLPPFLQVSSSHLLNDMFLTLDLTIYIYYIYNIHYTYILKKLYIGIGSAHRIG